MACSPAIPRACPEDQYCDASVFLCKPCSELCDPDRESSKDCELQCPGWKQPSPKDSTTPVHIQTPLTTAATHTGDIDLYVILGICLVALAVIILILIMTFFIIRQKRRNKSRKYKDNIAMENDSASLMNTENAKGPDIVDMKNPGNDQVTYSTEKDGSYRSMMGMSIEHPSDETPNKNHGNGNSTRSLPPDAEEFHKVPQETDNHMTEHRFHPPKSMDDDANTMPKSMSHGYTQSTVPLPERHNDQRMPNTPTDENLMMFTQVTPHISEHGETDPDEQPMSIAQQVSDTAMDQNQSHIQLESAEGCNPSFSFHSNSITTPETDVNLTGFDLRSSDTMPPARPQRSSQPSEDDSEVPFRNVMRAYDAFDANLHQMSFARGCLIGNDEFQVFTSNTRDQNECYDRVMNAMPTDIPEQIVVVQPEETRN